MRTQQDYLNLLEETVKAYESGDFIRSYKNDNAANQMFYYQHPDGDPKHRCAVGRCFNEDGIKRYGNESSTVTCLHEDLTESYNSDAFEELLKDEYKGFSIYFWRALQRLHDKAELWNGNKLNRIGIDFVETLKMKIIQGEYE